MHAEPIPASILHLIIASLFVGLFSYATLFFSFAVLSRIKVVRFARSIRVPKKILVYNKCRPRTRHQEVFIILSI
jgi:hypothetical protein